MPRDFLWDIADYVPTVIDANLTGRGAWLWGSDTFDSDANAGLLATFTSGDKLLIATNGGRWRDVSLDSPYASADFGVAYWSRQNPIQFIDTVVNFDNSGANVPQLLNWTSASLGGVNVGAAHPNIFHPRFGAVYKGMLAYAADPSSLNIVRFTVPGVALNDPNAYDKDASGDASKGVSYIATSHEITALAAMRSVILVFHKGSVERIRGNTPPRTPPTGATDTATYLGDMFLEPLFDRNGCQDPKTIAYWNDNVIFADEHGVQMTDGAVIKNLCSAGGILTYYRQMFAGKTAMAGGVFLDFYILTIQRGSSNTTLVCDLNSRQWFRFTNQPANTYVISAGSAGMERVWAGIAGTKRLGRLGPCFFPDFTNTPLQDDNGVPVLPTFETGWYRLVFARALGHRLMQEEGRTRVRFAYLSYDARLPAVTPDVLSLGYLLSPQDTAYTSMGTLPSTSEYTRFRLPVGQQPYGIAFKVTQTQPTDALRIFDLGIESSGIERSRL